MPRLRIHHLMAWMAVAAVLIWLSLWFDRTARNGPPIDNRLVIGSLIIAAIAIAGALTVVGFAIGWRRRGCAFPNSPGDWLLVVVTTLSAGYCAIILGFLFVFFVIDEDFLGIYYGMACCMMWLAWIPLHVHGISRYADTVPWRISLIVLAINPLLVKFMNPSASISALLLCMLCAAWSDPHPRIVRQWTHWLGVSITFALGLSLIAVSWD